MRYSFEDPPYRSRRYRKRKIRREVTIRVKKKLTSREYEIFHKDGNSQSALSQEFFTVPGVVMVQVYPNQLCLVFKSRGFNWDKLKPLILEVMRKNLNRGRKLTEMPPLQRSELDRYMEYDLLSI